jgi:subtilisin family serine protease
VTVAPAIRPPDFLLLLGLAALLAWPTAGTGAVPEFIHYPGRDGRTYELDQPATPGAPEVTAREVSRGRRVELTSSLVLELAPDAEADTLVQGAGLVAEWRPAPGWLVARAPDAAGALRAALRLAREPGVRSVSPSFRRHQAAPAYAWAAAPDDPYFAQQWYLDNSGNGLGQPPLATDLNFRGAWAMTRGQGLVVAVLDDGVDARHPDLTPGYLPDLAHNFFTAADSATHSLAGQFHGTAVAGLLAARGGNRTGLSGAAPAVQFTSWVIFDGNNNLPETAQLAAAFVREPDRIPLQNHSWGNAAYDFLEPTAVERVAISNAVHHGRSGKGTLMVRAAGNTRLRDLFRRQGIGDANLDGFANEPGAITVGSVRRDGRVASYSTAGACLLVAAPGGEISEGSQLFLLDPLGDAGGNSISSAGGNSELANYLYGSRVPAGTSFATPLVSGIVTLMLATQPGLSLPDTQRLLALSARHLDLADPQLVTNAAGLRVSPNVGFGIPDAGRAVRLAASFTGAPPRTTVTFSQSPALPVPDDGLRVRILGAEGSGLPESVPAKGGSGLHPDEPTAALALVNVGTATAPLTNDLRGAAALMFRRPNEFAEKIAFAAQAGAAFAVVVNTDFGNDRVLMLNTDFAAIPAVLVGGADGALLQELARTNPAARFQLELRTARVEFKVTNTLSLDWVQVRLQLPHPRMGDLRVTLKSPQGTRSVLQRASTATLSQLPDWTFSSQRHRFESSAGTWVLEVADEAPGSTATLDLAELSLTGIPIDDCDWDGLDDGWESYQFGGIDGGPADDGDGDQMPLAVEAYLGTSPHQSDRPLVPRLDADSQRWRVSFPVVEGARYQVETAPTAQGPWSVLGTASYRGDEGVWFAPYDLGTAFYRAVRLP